MNKPRTFWVEGCDMCGDFAARPCGPYQAADRQAGIPAGYDDFELFDTATGMVDNLATEIAFNDSSLRNQILCYLDQQHNEPE
jgi:hypothetical protein